MNRDHKFFFNLKIKTFLGQTTSVLGIYYMLTKSLSPIQSFTDIIVIISPPQRY